MWTDCSGSPAFSALLIPRPETADPLLVEQKQEIRESPSFGCRPGHAPLRVVVALQYGDPSDARQALSIPHLKRQVLLSALCTASSYPSQANI